jgi:hypothetical protein
VCGGRRIARRTTSRDAVLILRHAVGRFVLTGTPDAILRSADRSLAFGDRRQHEHVAGVVVGQEDPRSTPPRIRHGTRGRAYHGGNSPPSGPSPRGSGAGASGHHASQHRGLCWLRKQNRMRGPATSAMRARRPVARPRGFRTRQIPPCGITAARRAQTGRRSVARGSTRCAVGPAIERALRRPQVGIAHHGRGRCGATP